MHKWSPLFIFGLLFSLILLLACNGVDSTDMSVSTDTDAQVLESTELRVMGTTPIVTDWINQVASSRLTAESVMPYDIDPHSFLPGAQDVARVTESDLVIGIGSGYESKWLSDLLVTQPNLRYVELAEFVPLLETGEEHGEEHGEEDPHAEHDHGGQDPHFWFDPTRVMTAVEVIRGELSAIDPEGRDHYVVQADEYLLTLDQLDDYVNETLGTIPGDQRTFMTGHDSLGYLNDRYHLEAMESIIPNVDSEAGLTPDSLVSAVKFIKAHNVQVIFLEESHADKAVRAGADETGIRVAQGLNVETLADPSQTYVDFIKSNIEVIVENLMPVP